WAICTGADQLVRWPRSAPRHAVLFALELARAVDGPHRGQYALVRISWCAGRAALHGMRYCSLWNLRAR
ncbi:hypothetical protein CKJ90_32845, partial [Klebsiella pneumoniae]